MLPETGNNDDYNVTFYNDPTGVEPGPQKRRHENRCAIHSLIGVSPTYEGLIMHRKLLNNKLF